MKYKALYLPVNTPLTDGCDAISFDGSVFTYNEDDYIERSTGYIKAAKMFIVSYEYNTMVVIGEPSNGAKQWLKDGMEIKAVDCFQAIYDTINHEYIDKATVLTHTAPEFTPVIRITCPFCHELH